MTSALVVSTQCPLCGAPLDFTEGSNAVQCLHCRSNLLVTGRKQILSYYVSPKLDGRAARAKLARSEAHGGERSRLIKSELYFIPYYRLTGHDFRWEGTAERPKPESDVHPFLAAAASSDVWTSPADTMDLGSLLQAAGQFVNRLFGGTREKPRQDALQSLLAAETREKSVSSDPARSPSVLGPARVWDGTLSMPARSSRVRLKDRYVEKNFTGCLLDGAGLYSLGVRPSVLRLKLFRRDVLASKGKIVQANLTPEEALSRGMMTYKLQPLRYRRVLGRILSIIYFPFWVIEVARDGKTFLAIVDAVSQSVVKRDASPSLYRVLERELDSEPQVVGFRPLTCPNCGWDLPFVPGHVTFFCSTCERNWHILGSDLSEVPYRVAQIGEPGDPGAVEYLPFWVLNTPADDELPSRFFLPAFRYRRLKSLSDLAVKMSQKQPDYREASGKRPALHGCFYDEEDAVMFTQLTQVALARKPLERIHSLKNHDIPVNGSMLTWFPFDIQGAYLVDPLTGFSLSRSLLL